MQYGKADFGLNNLFDVFCSFLTFEGGLAINTFEENRIAYHSFFGSTIILVDLLANKASLREEGGSWKELCEHYDFVPSFGRRRLAVGETLKLISFHNINYTVKFIKKKDSLVVN